MKISGGKVVTSTNNTETTRWTKKGNKQLDTMVHTSVLRRCGLESKERLAWANSETLSQKSGSLGCSSVVEHSSSSCEALCSIPSTQKKTKQNKPHSFPLQHTKT